jgi:hypothetical protein
MEAEPVANESAPGWSDPAWKAEAHAWIEERLIGLALTVTGPIEQPHLVWWSTALRVPTDGGVLWFKAVQPDGAFEMRLTPFLARRWPAHTAEVVATDPERGWMLSRDAGVRLRDSGGEGSRMDAWAELLPQYAELQIAAAGRRADLEHLGVPDRTLVTIRADLERALHETETLLLGQKDGLTASDHRALLDGLPEFGALCDRLAAYGIPDSIQHDDLHDGNVFVRDGGYVFFDWGDACISHPFHTLVVTLRSLAYGQKLTPGGAELIRLRDAYLEPWGRFGSHAELIEAAELARRTGTIGRAMAWRWFALAMPPPVRAEHMDSVPYGLRLYLADGPWGSWDDGTF